MTDLQTALRGALLSKTLNEWDEHEQMIRKPSTQQEQQVTNPTPVINHSEGYKGFVPSNNVMRATFDAVKNAPMMKHGEYVEMLQCSGFKPSSTSAVLYQLIRAKQIFKNENGNLKVTQDEYTPIKAPSKKRKQVVVLDEAPEPKPRKIVLVKKPRNDEGIAALKADGGPAVEKFDVGSFKHHLPKAFHPSAIVDNLSVLHARELYDYLKKIFGGN